MRLLVTVAQRPGGSRRLRVHALDAASRETAGALAPTVDALATGRDDDLTAAWIRSAVSPLWGYGRRTLRAGRETRALPRHAWLVAVADSASIDPVTLGVTPRMVTAARTALRRTLGDDWLTAGPPRVAAAVDATGAAERAAAATAAYEERRAARIASLTQVREERATWRAAATYICGPRVPQHDASTELLQRWAGAAQRRALAAGFPDDRARTGVTRLLAQTLQRRGGHEAAVATRVAAWVCGEPTESAHSDK